MSDLGPKAPPRRLVWAAVTLAIVLPLVHITCLRTSPTFDVPIIDSAEYVAAARDELAGGGPGVYFHSPLYSWFLAVVFAIAGPRYGLVRILQALLNGATCAILYAMAGRCFNRRVATVAALAWAAYGPVIFFTGEILNVTWSLFLLTLALYLVVRASEAATASSWLIAGTVTGLAAITRPDVVPFAALTILFVRRKRTHALAFAAAFAAPLLLVGARNQIVAGRFAVLPGNSGINFYIGNNPEFARTIGIRPGLPYESLKALPARTGLPDDPADPGHSRYFYAAAFRYLAGDATGSLQALAFKLRILASGLELPETFDLYTTRAFSPLLALFAWRVGSFGFPFGALLPLALWGAWTHRPRAPWLALFVGSMAVPLVGYWSSSRYRMPIVPVLILWAAAALVRLFDLYRSGRYRPLAAAAAAITAAAVAFNLPYDHFSRTHRFDAEMYGFAGLQLTRAGRLDEGLRLLARAVELDPERIEFQSALGYALVESGRGDEGLAHLTAAAALGHDVAPDWSNLGVAYEARGDVEAAIRSFSRSLQLDPGQSHVRENLRRLRALHRPPATEAADTLTVSPDT